MKRAEFNRLRRLQREFDSITFDNGYKELDFNHAKVQHIGEHVGKAYLKLYRFKQAKEERAPDNVAGRARNLVVKEVIPDLLIYRTQLANTLRFNLYSLVGERESPAITVNQALGMIGMARALIDDYIEPQRHDANAARPAARANIKNYAVPYLHDAAHGIALQFGISDMDRAYLERLEHKQQQPLIGR